MPSVSPKSVSAPIRLPRPPSRSGTRSEWFSSLWAAAALGADQAAKAAILAAGALTSPLERSWHERPAAFTLLTVLMFTLLVIAIAAAPRYRHGGAFLMLGAGFSNLLDYARFGAILNIITIGNLQLNIADILVVSGAIWLLAFPGGRSGSQ